MADPSPPRVLLLIAHFLPGMRFGGPVRTVANLLERLGGQFQFHVLTRDRDFLSQRPYEVEPNRWLDWQGLARIRYADERHLGARALAEAGRELRPDLLYLNSFFHPRFSLLPYQLWRRGAFGAAGLVLAPRGEFAPEALAQKAWRKRILLRLGRALGQYREPLWQASSPLEGEDIRRAMGARARVQVAPDLVAAPCAVLPERLRRKEPGSLRVLFLGRVTRMKNLPFLLDRLAELKGRVDFTLAGPGEDAALWAQCRERAARLPANVSFQAPGAVPPEQVPELLRGHDLLFQPSLGENFGHSILEALVHACPVLISDRTPWRGLAARQAGWELPLEDPVAFRERLQWLVDLDEEGWQTWSRGARQLGLAQQQDPAVLAQNVELFQRALRERPVR
jgi:glycosyltransferase involved in cell wall biosynthesis